MSTELQHVASLSEPTVQAIARGDIGPESRPRAQKQPRNSPIETITVHPEVWATALELAGGRALRIRVDSPTSVTVLNHDR